MRILIADDSEVPSEIADTVTYRLPVGTSVNAGRNILLDKVRTEYFVLLDDDFLFTKYTKLEKLEAILDSHDDVAIAGGRCIDFGNALRPGPSTLEVKDGTLIRKFLPDDFLVKECDMTSNFWMGRTSFFREHNIRFPEELDITEEHEKFFLDFPGRILVSNEVSLEHYPDRLRYQRSGKLGMNIKYDYINLRRQYA